MGFISPGVCAVDAGQDVMNSHPWIISGLDRRKWGEGCPRIEMMNGTSGSCTDTYENGYDKMRDVNLNAGPLALPIVGF